MPRQAELTEHGARDCLQNQSQFVRKAEQGRGGGAAGKVQSLGKEESETFLLVPHFLSQSKSL